MRTRVLCAVAYDSPHLVPLFDELAREDLDVTRACLLALPERRAALGWPEMEAGAPWLQPWRRSADRGAYWRELARADVAILPGPFQLRSMPLHFWRRRLARRPVLAWSEPFLARRRRSRAKLLAHRVILRSIDGPRTHLLSIGPRALADYTASGLESSPAWLFGYTVLPALGSPVARPARTGPLRLLAVAELDRVKGIDVLVEALAQPELHEHGWMLDVVGDGAEGPALRRLVEERSLADCVRFLGALPRTECLRTFPEHDALVVPSRFDGWGAVVNEALEAGLCVVASDAVGASLLVRHGENGFVVPKEDPRALAVQLAMLAANPELARRMGAAGPAAIAPWRPAAVAPRLAALCRAVAGHGPWPAFAAGPLSRLR